MPLPQSRIHVQSFQTSSGNPFNFRLREVKGGVFQMGSDGADAYGDEQPVHQVQLSDFWMAEYPVTQGLWKAVMGAEDSPFYFQGDLRPAENVSWQKIVDEFLPRLNALTGQSYRLPTEAEWEYAARGGIHQSPFIYAGSNDLESVAWYDENSHDETKPVGLKKPNALGIYDMSGNVYEWCADWYDGSEYYEVCAKEGMVENPQGPQEGSYRVVRGGSWIINDPRDCRVSHRDFAPRYEYDLVGFRLVVSVLQSVG